MNETVIEEVEHIKFLGFIIDKKMNLNTQIIFVGKLVSCKESGREFQNLRQ